MQSLGFAGFRIGHGIDRVSVTELKLSYHNKELLLTIYPKYGTST